MRSSPLVAPAFECTRSQPPSPLVAPRSASRTATQLSAADAAALAKDEQLVLRTMERDALQADHSGQAGTLQVSVYYTAYISFI